MGLGLSVLQAAAILGGCAALAGCSTHYQPRPGPRLAVVMQGGNLAYQRDGQTFEHGMFGAGLVDAVAGDPAAQDAAEIYSGRLMGGVIADLAGLVCFVGGTAWAASTPSSSSGSFDFVDDNRGAIFLGATACLLAGTIAGLSLIASAQPYQWDAINIYNDNADARGRQYRLGPPVAQPPAAPVPAAPAPAAPAPAAPAPAAPGAPAPASPQPPPR
jgi:hypothetical protein